MIIKKLLKKTYLLYISRKRYRKWIADCNKLRSVQNVISIYSLPTKEKSIILIPHADDEWVGCSSVLRDNSEVLLVNMDMQGGDNPSLHQNRKAELSAMATRHKKKLKTIIGDKVKSLSSIIKEYKPGIIYVPFYFDWHEEHILTMKILRDSLIETGEKLKVAMYQVSLPIISDRVTHCVTHDKSKWTEKWEIFEKVYKSQLNIPYKRFAISERIQGSLCSSYAAEVFSICRSEEWLTNFDEWLLTPNEIELVKSNLQDFIRTNELTKEFSRKRVWKTPK